MNKRIGHSLTHRFIHWIIVYSVHICTQLERMRNRVPQPIDHFLPEIINIAGPIPIIRSDAIAPTIRTIKHLTVIQKIVGELFNNIPGMSEHQQSGTSGASKRTVKRKRTNTQEKILIRNLSPRMPRP